MFPTSDNEPKFQVAVLFAIVTIIFVIFAGIAGTANAFPLMAAFYICAGVSAFVSFLSYLHGK